MNSRKKKIVLSLALFLTTLTIQPKKSESMGFSFPVGRNEEIHTLCPGAQVQNQKPIVAPTISPRVDKIRFRRVPELPLYIYAMDQNFVVRPEISKIIKELRAGDLSPAFVGNTLLLFVIYGIYLMASRSRSSASAYIPQQNLQNPALGLAQPIKYPPIFNNLDPRGTCPADRRGSVLREGRMDEKCPSYVMSYGEARELVDEAYPGFIDVSEGCKISDWQSAKKIYHVNGVGIKPTEYGFSQAQLNLIRKQPGYERGGLIAYAQRGHRLPPIEMVRAYSERLKELCEQAPIRLTNVPYYDVNGKWPSTVYIIPPVEGERKGIMIIFNASTTDLITADQQRPSAFIRLEEEGFIGSPKWMMQWNNTNNTNSTTTPAPNDGFTPLSSFESDVLGVTPVDSSSSDS